MAQVTSPQPALSCTVVGQGAVGLLAACQLSLHGIKVQLWLRQRADKRYYFSRSKGSDIVALPAATKPDPIVLIPVKAYAVVSAVQSLLPYLSASAQLILSHNGMGVASHVLPLLKPAQGLWFLTTTHAALKTDAVSVSHTGVGNSVLAPLNNAARQHLAQASLVPELMDKALGPLSLVDDITPYLWQKLVINAVINPLTAVANCRNGELADSRYQCQIRQLVTEVVTVASAAGYPLGVNEQMQRVYDVIAKTAANYSSMQQDLAHQRRTEIDAITGYIVAQAMALNIDTPANTAMLQQITQLQQRV